MVMEAKSHSVDVGDVDSSSSSALVNTDLSPASLSLPGAALGIMGSQLVTPMTWFFSVASIHTYCNGKQELPSQVSTQTLTAELPMLLFSFSKCYFLISMSETQNHICRMDQERPCELV